MRPSAPANRPSGRKPGGGLDEIGTRSHHRADCYRAARPAPAGLRHLGSRPPGYARRCLVRRQPGLGRRSPQRSGRGIPDRGHRYPGAKPPGPVRRPQSAAAGTRQPTPAPSPDVRRAEVGRQVPLAANLEGGTSRRGLVGSGCGRSCMLRHAARHAQSASRLSGNQVTRLLSRVVTESIADAAALRLPGMAADLRQDA
jgi:hypothetical protein